MEKYFYYAKRGILTIGIINILFIIFFLKFAEIGNYNFDLPNNLNWMTFFTQLVLLILTIANVALIFLCLGNILVVIINQKYRKLGNFIYFSLPLILFLFIANFNLDNIMNYLVSPIEILETLI